MTRYMTIDVESIGLHGEGFAIGWVIVDRSLEEYESGYLACPAEVAEGTHEDYLWVEKNVLPHLPAENETSPDRVRQKFWNKWLEVRDSVILFADCGWPVEASFLNACAKQHPDSIGKAPYPPHDVATALLTVGRDPIANYKRLENELPVHHPTADARQSARLLVESLNLARLYRVGLEEAMNDLLFVRFLEKRLGWDVHSPNPPLVNYCYRFSSEDNMIVPVSVDSIAIAITSA